MGDTHSPSLVARRNRGATQFLLRGLVTTLTLLMAATLLPLASPAAADPARPLMQSNNSTDDVARVAAVSGLVDAYEAMAADKRDYVTGGGSRDRGIGWFDLRTRRAPTRRWPIGWW